MGRRTVLLIAAVIIAAIASALLFSYVHSANDRAVEDQTPVEVLVAKKQIAAGTTGAAAQEAGSFELQTVAKASVAPGALSDVTPIQAQVAIAPIYPGEQILTQKFATSVASSSLPIPPGKLAISLQLGDPERVAGFVNPGSSVVVFATVDDPDRGGATTRAILAKALVIAVGPTTALAPPSGEGNTEDVPSAILTLALTQRDAQKTILAQDVGELYFGLLTPRSRVTDRPVATAANLFA